MTRSLISTAALAVFTTFSLGQTVSISPTAPDTDIIDSSPIGGIDTALFDENANANHSRGQLFTLPDEDVVEITSITLQKSNTQTYTNDLLTIRIFEGTQDQWNTGTGHETAIDGDDYLVDTPPSPSYTRKPSRSTAPSITTSL